MYSPSYREKYAEFLNRDFPVIPYPISSEQFWKFEDAGNRLVNIHLLSSAPSQSNRFTGTDTEVEKVSYKSERVYINRSSYFSDVSEDVYNFIVGGYQPCNRWLRERKGVKLHSDDLITYSKIVSAIEDTIQVMKEIDHIYTF